MNLDDWKLRAKAFLLRFWQPTSACMTCMPGSLANVMSPSHWATALQTGLFTGALVLLLSFTPAVKWFRNRFSNAAIVGCLTVLGDSFAHPDHYGFVLGEALVTGAVSFALALGGSYVFDAFARRVTAAWARRSTPAP